MNRLERLRIRIRCALGHHTWEGCACRYCGKENHDWQWILLDPYAPMTNLFDEIAASRKRCRRCKMWDGGRPPAIDPDELPPPFRDILAIGDEPDPGAEHDPGRGS